jgi:hypothetical protein
MNSVTNDPETPVIIGAPATISSSRHRVISLSAFSIFFAMKKVKKAWVRYFFRDKKSKNLHSNYLKTSEIISDILIPKTRQVKTKFRQGVQ